MKTHLIFHHILRRLAQIIFFANNSYYRKSAIICVICGATALASCDRREITYYMESEITILADWSQADLSEQENHYGATAVFFPQGGGEPKRVLMGDRTRQKVRLPAGVYDVVLFNRSFDDFGAVAFRGDLYHEFCATAHKVETRVNPETRATTRVIVQTPEDVAAGTHTAFEVTEAMLGNYSAEAQARMQSRAVGNDTRAEEDDPERYTLRLKPEKLTQRVNVTLHIEGLHNVHHAVGVIDGVSESVSLCNGSPVGDPVSQQFVLTDIAFEEGSPFDGVMTGTFNVFGLDCSDLRNLTFTFYLADGETIVTHGFEAEIIRTETSFEYYITLAPPPMPDVKPTEGEDAGFDVDVNGWGEPEDVEVPVDK